MHNIFITGSSGFIGTNLKLLLKSNYIFYEHKKGEPLNIHSETVIHLAGKAHDLNNTYNSREYYLVNTDFTIEVFDSFLNSSAKVFIFLSSVKAAADSLDCILTEEYLPCPISDYGKSKLNAENYILSKTIPNSKRVYILRPCMIHGPGNKGNLNYLYNFVKLGLPWPLGSFENKRSFCSIENISFIINELIENNTIVSGIYNISDDESISTNELIRLISLSKGKNPIIWKVNKSILISVAKIGSLLKLPLNTIRLRKLTESYEVSNIKIKNAIKKTLPLTSINGILKTLESFKD
jgi:nucleoside-diphosphate-sugar epimerase